MDGLQIQAFFGIYFTVIALDYVYTNPTGSRFTYNVVKLIAGVGLIILTLMRLNVLHV